MYKVGYVLNSNPNMVNGCEEAVISNFRISEPLPYKVLFLQKSSVKGYYFHLDDRTDQMLDNAYIECINPHFCYIKNLYSVLSGYELKILGYQDIPDTNTSCLYLKANNRYLQIFISADSEMYKDNEMFVYLYEANKFEELKLFNYGNFFICNNLKDNISLINSVQSTSFVQGIIFHQDKAGTVCYIHETTKRNLVSVGLYTNKAIFRECKDLNDFKKYIL